jgi:hypothetical protein
MAPLMPNAGEDHSSFSDIFGNTYAQVIELMAGRAAERMLLDGEPASPADDLRQARELALLFCKSEEAIEGSISHCEVAARDLLMSYGDLLIVLSTVLRIKRILNGVEIDKIIIVAWAVLGPRGVTPNRYLLTSSIFRRPRRYGTRKQPTAPISSVA